MVYNLRFFLQNAVCLIILIYLVPVLFTFYTQGVLKLKNNSGAKRLISLPGTQYIPVIFMGHLAACFRHGSALVTVQF